MWVRCVAVIETPSVPATALRCFLRTAWQRLGELLSGELKHEELPWLLSPHRHLSLLARRRATMVVNRVRLFALMFAILTPLWSVIDLIVFPFPLWFGLAAMRVVASVAFASLVVYYRPNGELLDAYRSLALLFAIPTVFYVASYTLLSHYQLSGVSAAIGAGYAFLPFVLLAGLAVFPLTLLENLVIASPILVAQGVAGSLRWSSLDWPSFAGAFWLLMLLTGVAAMAGVSQLAFMIALVRQAIRDTLTGVFSRSSAEEVLDLQFTIATRNQADLALAFIDLDHFKAINDKFGHDAGDKALQQMTAAISDNLRQGDVLARWGGEEFVLIMPHTSQTQALTALQRMQDLGLGPRPDGTPLTASIGLAERCADAVTDWSALVELADRRMYLAKSAGRHRVVHAQGEVCRVDPLTTPPG